MQIGNGQLASLHITRYAHFMSTGGPQLAIHVAKAVRAAQGDEGTTANAVVEALTTSLADELRRSDPLVLRRDGGILRLGECALVPMEPDHGLWLKELRDGLKDRGVAGLVLSGAWCAEDTNALSLALCAGDGPPEARLGEIRAALSCISKPAAAMALDEEELRRFLSEVTEPDLAPRDRATFLYARLVALAKGAYETASTGSPDHCDNALRATLRGLIDGLSEPAFARRMFAVTLRRSSETAQAYRAANVACLSLAMGRELGLSREKVLGVGYAGLFHGLGAAQCLRGRNLDGIAALRLQIASERDATRPEGAPHMRPLAGIVAVAEAFDVLEGGTTRQESLTPCAALTALTEDESLDPEVVALLQRVLGERPRGSVLRLEGGDVVVVLESGATGAAAVVKHLVGPKLGQLAVLEPERIEDEDVSPSEFGLHAWKIVLTDGEAPLLGPKGFSQPEASQQVQLAARKFADALQKGVRAALHHPTGDLRRKQAGLGLSRALDGLRESEALPLTLEFRANGISIGVGEILSRKKADSLVSALRTAGVRRLTFNSDVSFEQLESLCEAAAVADSEGDFATRLWESQLPDVHCEEHDPLRGSGAAPANATRTCLCEARAALKVIRAQLPAGLDVEDRFCAKAGPGDSAYADAGDLGELLSRVSAATPPDSTIQALRWAEKQHPGPDPDDVARYQTTALCRALWRNGLDPALDVMDTFFDEHGKLPASLIHRLATPDVVALLVRRLREGGAKPDVGGGVAFLQPLGKPAVNPTCRAYAGLHLDEALRRVLATFLVEHLKGDPRPLIPLSLSRHPQIAREALILLSINGVGSLGHTLLVDFSKDRSKPNLAARATVAQEVLNEIGSSGDTTSRKDALVGLASPEKSVRLEAAAKLKAGDEEAFTLLSKIVQDKDFANRDEDELQVMLDALSVAGGGRALRILEKLSARNKTFSLIKSGTRRIGKLATGRLKAFKQTASDTGTTKMLPVKEVCPRCKFVSTPGSRNCLQCGAAFDATAKIDIHDAPTVRIPRRDKKIPGGFASPAASAKIAPESVLAWLSCPLFPSMPIGPKPLVEIGRGSCDLQLVHESVSRRHAVIRVAGDQMTLEDRSSYGTWVNGERVLTSPIQIGDVLTIGPFDVTLESAQHKSYQDHDTRPLRTFSTSEAIGGRLERVSLAEVLQQIEFNEKTGTLEIFTENQNGTLVIYDGKPVYAEMGELRDNAAVLLMLQQTRGNFSFRSKIEAGEMTMNITLTGLLLEASRIIDEEEPQPSEAEA